jgi:isopentenyldiphosphate isomerase
MKSCCSNVLIRNTILRFFGLIPVAVIKGRESTVGSRRLLEEMGFKRSSRAFHFIYKAPFDNGLTEHEFDHVMIGYYDETPL